MQTLDFKNYLQQQLVSRCKENPSYSLRSFAKQIDVDPSRLSKILRGQRPTSMGFIEQVGMRLDLSLDDIERFKLSSSSSHNSVDEELEEKKQTLQVALDQFEIISDWHHYAILELIKTDSFEATPKWVASALGVSINQVNACVERLQRVNFLKVSKDGQWKDMTGGSSSHVLNKNITTQAHRRHQKQILDQAKIAMDEVDMIFRDQSSRMITTSYKRINEAKDMIQKFRNELSDFLGASKSKDTVYQLSVSLFPLSNKEMFKQKRGSQ